MSLFDNKYTFIKDLGKGGFGKVFLAQEKVSNRFVAIKQLLNTNKSEQEDIIHEIETISKFENPNIDVLPSFLGKPNTVFSNGILFRW